MTRNNLANHLAWLLNNVQPSKPLGPSLPTIHDAFGSSRSVQSEFSQPAASGDLPSTKPPVSAPNASSSQHALEVAIDIDLTPDDDPFANTYEEEETTSGSRMTSANMARLTTRPTKKPSLMSRQEQLPTPGVGKLQQAYAASLSKDDVSSSTSIASHLSKKRSPPSVKQPKRPLLLRDLTPEIPEDADENLQDLTGVDTTEPEAKASTAYDLSGPKVLWNPESPPSRGKKRKSSEVTESPSKSRPRPAQDIKEEDDDEFPDICDLVDADLITPIMYKRRNAGLSTQKSPAKLDLSTLDTTVLTQRMVTQTVSTTETTIHRTGRTPYRSKSPGVSQVESSLGHNVLPASTSNRSPKSPSPVKRSLTNRSPNLIVEEEDLMSDSGIFEPPSPGPRQPRKFTRSDVVMDSDDELQATPDRNVSDLSFVTASAGTPSTISKGKRTSPRGIEDEAKEAASEECAIETPSKQRPHSIPRGGSRPDYSDIMDIDSLDEEQKPEDGEPERAQNGSESEGETLLMDIFKQQPHVLDFISKTIQEKLAKNSDDYRRSLLERWPAERKAQVKREKGPLKEQQAAVSKARATHETHKQLEARHEKLLTQLTDAYDADEDTEELEARLEISGQKIEESEDALKQALVAAGVTAEIFLHLPDPPARQPVGMALGSMTHPITTPKTPAVLSRESTLIPECASQSIQQSQAVSRPQPVMNFDQTRAIPKPQIPPFPRQIPPRQPLENRNISRAPPLTTVDDQFLDDFIDDDDELWAQQDVSRHKPHATSVLRASDYTKARSPAKPRIRHQDNFSDYGDDDIAAMVAMAEEVEDLEQQQPSFGLQNNRHARPILSEASGNTIPAARVKATTKNPAQPTPKLKIPPELMRQPWSPDVLRAFKDRFRLQGFRHNQLEAINATLGGQDAFVLMPTGGGKSLCYQLPAVIHSGKTRGVTIVVTPLLSLMQDQVDHLTARGIIAKSFNGGMDRSERQDILESFKKRNPEHYVQLLYVTPEMINKSTAFLNGLATLYNNKRFARLVIDEAHCVSQWGHDFRPDYKELGQIRRQFPGVPIMALTATATNNVITDIQHNLDMRHCKVFSQSFNRPNLYYEVRQKEKQPVERIAELINDRYRGKTGIVYALSRKNTEAIAKKLQDYGIQAAHYHASMDKDKKTDVQRSWQAGNIKVVVATIAFGMGIDKPDVRFVIHHSLPKSLEGYYQETGRAGRDNSPSDCYLFFSHGDIYQLRKFIDESDGSHAQKERQKEMLNRVVMFCENKRDCRRSQLLHYFGESFSKDKCDKTCDNCKIGGVYETQDRTQYAQAVLQAVMFYTRLTMIQCTDILRGSKRPDKDGDPQPFHGIAKCLTKHEVNGIITSLFSEHALGEENKIGGGGIAIQYFILGHEAASFLTGGRKLQVIVRTGGDKSAPVKATKKKTSKRKAAEELELTRPASTFISSPVRGGARKTKKGKSVANFIDDEAIAEGGEDDLDPWADRHADVYEQDGFVVADDDEDDDYFDPPVAPLPRQRQRTLDELPRSTLPATAQEADGELHEDVASAFLDEAKVLEEETRNNKGFRRPLFTEAQMKQMAIRWADSLDKMYCIPGIDHDKVNKYGVRFIPLVRKYQLSYQEMMGQKEDALATIPATAGPSTSRRGPQQQQQQQPGDFIDLVSEDEEDEDYEEPGVASKYFGAAGQNDPLQSQLESWQERFAATSQMEDSEPVSRGRSTSKKGFQRGGKRQYYSRGSGSKSTSGVSKRKGWTGPRSGTSRGSSGTAKSGAGRSTTTSKGGGSRGGSGIGLMPF